MGEATYYMTKDALGRMGLNSIQYNPETCLDELHLSQSKLILYISSFLYKDGNSPHAICKERRDVFLPTTKVISQGIEPRQRPLKRLRQQFEHCEGGRQSLERTVGEISLGVAEEFITR
jgi:hypothetical protein